MKTEAIYITPATDSTCAWNKEKKRLVSVDRATKFESLEHAVNYWHENKAIFPEHVVVRELVF